MFRQLTQLTTILVMAFVLLLKVDLATADDSTLDSDLILNTDFGIHLGMVADMNAEGQAGIFIYQSIDEQPLLSLLSEDIKALALEYTGHYLVAYDESGQALYELPDERYQMQITTPNGAVNMNYGSFGSDLQAADAMTETEDILLKQSADGLYGIYLLGTGELQVVMGPDAENMRYQITFTGVPALNVRFATIASGFETATAPAAELMAAA